MSKQRIQLRLYNFATGGAGAAGDILRSAGGSVLVSRASNASKATLFKADGSSQANGFALTAGGAEFYIEDSVDTSVDVFVMSPSGHFACKFGVLPGYHEMGIDLQNRRQTLMCPVAAADYTANTETATIFTFPQCNIEPNPSVFVSTLEAAKTLSVGLLSSETGGSATGIMAAISVAAAGALQATLANGAQTLGALLKVLSDGGTVNVPRSFTSQGTATNARTLSVTTAAASASFKAYAYVPYYLTALQPGMLP